MASTNIAFMPQNIFPPYYQDQTTRASVVGAHAGRNGLWSSPSPATPQSSSATSGAVWGSPLSLVSSTIPFHSSSKAGTARTSPELAHSSLAALAAESEPILYGDRSVGSVLAAARAQSSTASSRFSSRQNSQSDIVPPSPNSTVGLGFACRSGAASPSSSITSSIHPLEGDIKQVPKTHGTQNQPQKQASVQNQSNQTQDEIINTAIVVKNIPFAIKKEQLIEFMMKLEVPLPYAFNYHFDNGVFRGLAFANFATPEETAQVISTLNGKELGGRKLRVEYKKMLPFQERERIEREKRERRGQLEEQHHQKNGQQSSKPQQQQAGAGKRATPRSPIPASSSMLHLQMMGSDPLQQQPITAPLSNFVTPLATPSSSPLPPHIQQRFYSPIAVDMNVPENLQIFTTLMLFKSDPTKLELNIPTSTYSHMSPSQVHILNLICQYLELEQTRGEDRGLILTKGHTEPSALNKGDIDGDFWNTGIFRNATVTSSAHPLTRLPLASMHATNSFKLWK